MWSATLRGSLRERALEQVRRLTSEFERAVPEPKTAWGAAEAALLFHFVALEWPESDYSDKSNQCVERMFDLVESEPLPPGFIDGVMGIGWVTQFLRGSHDDEVLEQLDALALGYVSLCLTNRRFDLCNGLVGAGMYALERWPGGNSQAILKNVVGALAELRIEAALPLDLGLAHGLAGITSFLAAAAPLVPTRELLLEMLPAWQRFQLRDSVSLFPTSVTAAGTLPGSSRAAWCYGDVSIATALTAAAAATELPEYRVLAEKTIASAGKRTMENSGVVDATFCHGAAGVAHLFNRLQRPSLARAWVEQTLSLHRDGIGIGGYAHVSTDHVLVAETGLVTGIAGIALVLLAAASDHEPHWDRLFLPSRKPSSRRRVELPTVDRGLDDFDARIEREAAE